MTTQLNAATRLRAETKVPVTADRITPEQYHTYMASLYTQLLKVVRRSNPRLDDSWLKKELKLANHPEDNGREIVFNDTELKAKGVSVQAHLKELGWVTADKAGRVIDLFRKDGSWPMRITIGSPLSVLTLHQVSHERDF